MSRVVNGRDTYELSNQLGGYVGPDTPDSLAKFLLRESNAAADLADEIERQSKLIDELVEALEVITYKDGDTYRIGYHGDADVTDEIAPVLSKAQSHQTHKPNEGQ